MAMDKNEKIGPIVLLIIDGWGVAEISEGNAITKAKTPNFKELVANYPATTLNQSHLSIPKKKINLAANYIAMGTGKMKAVKNNLSLLDYLEQAKLSWQIITEPEKISYASFFFNNKKNSSSANCLIFSPEFSDNYSQTPAMAAEAICSELLKKIKSKKINFLMAVFASPDLIAHSGDFAATIKAVEIIDQKLSSIVKTVLDNSGVLIITSAHGNAEEAIEMNTELKNTKDTTNPVPFIIVGRQFEGKSFGFQEAPDSNLSLVPPSGSLIDVAPTILNILGLDIADKFDGKSLIS